MAFSPISRGDAHCRPIGDRPEPWLPQRRLGLGEAATGILIFEGSLVGVQGPMQEEAERSASALAGQVDPMTPAGSAGAERNTLWVLLAVATANVAPTTHPATAEFAAAGSVFFGSFKIICAASGANY